MLREWLEVLHIVSVVCWFAALFYLPRLFVYHAAAQDQIGIERFKIMERKLFRGIATPAMVASLGFGGGLFSYAPDYYLAAGWFYAKLAMVALLLGYHFLCGVYLRQFRANRNTHSHVFFRWFNEVPVVLLIAIVAMVVVRPF